jgi:hypothetical protein
MAGINAERDDRSFLVVGDAQAWADVSALGASMLHAFQALAVGDDRLGITRRDAWRRRYSDVVEKLGKLIF